MYRCVILIIFLLALSGCEKKSRSDSKQKVLRLNFQSQPVTVDPRRSGDPFSSHLLFMLFEGLTHLERDGSVSMSLAKSVDISEDLKTYTFHLRDSKWSDGIELTAKDFEKTWKRILDPRFPSLSSYLFYSIKNAEKAKKGLLSIKEVGIYAKDNKTFIVELEHPTPYFLELISFCSFFPIPTHVNDMHKPLKFDPQKKLVSNGPFLINKWEHDREIQLKKNPYYWDRENTFLDKIVIHIISNEMTSLQMYEKGEIDVLGGFISPIPLEALPSLSKEKSLRTKPIAGTMISAFNTQKYPFNNKNIRKAFSYSINRRKIINNITQSNELVATGAIPPILKMNKLRHFFKDGDIDRAKESFAKGLDELRIDKKSFPQVTLSYYTSELQHALAQAIQAQWREALDVDVKLEQLDFKIFLDKMIRRNYQAANLSWIAQYNDQMNILERFKNHDEQKNYPGWGNKKYIQILESSMEMQRSDTRHNALEKAESILMNEMPFAPIFHFNIIYMQKQHVRGIEITPIGNFDFRHSDIVY